MTDAKPCTDLAFATDQELAEELLKRFRNCLIVAEYELKNDDNKLGIVYFWSGGWTAALGLAQRAQIRIADDISGQPDAGEST